MRIHVFSDLHQEFGEVDVPVVDCDCVVIAGDASTKLNGLKWLQRRFRKIPVLYVCGNHEFYGAKFPRLIDKLRDGAQGSNVHVLENDSVTIDGVHFFGCTLWSDMNLLGDWREGSEEAGRVMNDYKRIRSSTRHFARLHPADTRSAHAASLDAMREFFGKHDSDVSVVISHHAPSILSLPERRRERLTSCAYASHLDSFIEEHQPSLWIHGHIHHNSDYRIGRTRVMANPRGYPDEPNMGFVPNLVVTVGE